MITRLSSPVVKECPYRREEDRGKLVITIPGEAPELHELAQRVDNVVRVPITHEAFTAEVAKLVPGAVITSYWKTGRWTVKVTDRVVLR